MKKIFSLICLFVFGFFGVANTVLASTDPDNTLSLFDVKVQYEANLTTDDVMDPIVATVGIRDDNKLVVTTEEAARVQFAGLPEEYVFNYNASGNYLIFDEDISGVPGSVSKMLVSELFIAICNLHGFKSGDCESILDTNLNDYTYEEDGIEYSVTQVDTVGITQNLYFKISLNPDLKETIKTTLDSLIEDPEEPEEPVDPEEPEEPPVSSSTSSSTTEKPANNPSTSDMTIGNIIIIGGSLLLITGYSVLKIKKMKKEGLN